MTKARKEIDPVQDALDTIVDRVEKCKAFRPEIFSPLVRAFVARKQKAMKTDDKLARFERACHSSKCIQHQMPFQLIEKLSPAVSPPARIPS